jgi:hypothetical protein
VTGRALQVAAQAVEAKLDRLEARPVAAAIDAPNGAALSDVSCLAPQISRLSKSGARCRRQAPHAYPFQSENDAPGPDAAPVEAIVLSTQSDDIACQRIGFRFVECSDDPLPIPRRHYPQRALRCLTEV